MAMAGAHTRGSRGEVPRPGLSPDTIGAMHDGIWAHEPGTIGTGQVVPCSPPGGQHGSSPVVSVPCGDIPALMACVACTAERS